jgi:hypothetical protein
MSLDDHRVVVEHRMNAGEPFGQVEVFINEAALDQNEKAALWLLAWSLRDTWAQRREALAMVSSLTWRPASG